MAWVTVGVAAAGAVAGKMKNDAAKAREAKETQLAAETQRYSPWTGMTAQPVHHADSVGGDIFGGGVQGAMVGQSLSKGMAGKPDPTSGGSGGDGALGSKGMSQEFGQMGQGVQMPEVQKYDWNGNPIK